MAQSILSFDESKKHAFLNSFDIVFCDCDGVIWEGTTHQPIKDVEQGINALKQHGKRVIFITNNSTRTDEEFLEKFQSMGLNIDREDIVHPVRAIIDYLQDIKFNGLIYCVATENFKNALRNAGFNIIDGPNQILPESFQELARNVFDAQPVRAVIVDVDLNLSSAKLIRANAYLQHPSCVLIGGAADIEIPFGPSNTIGPGAYLHILEHSSKRKALVFGKPGSELIAHLTKKFELCDPRRVLFVGDIIETDVVFGKMAGFQTMLALTGCAKKDELSSICSETEIPDYYTNSIADFMKFL